MTLEEINKKLADIAKTLDEIAWDKEMKEADRQKIEKEVDSVDGIIISEKEFGKEQLENYTKSVQTASDKGKDFVSKRDVAKEKVKEQVSNDEKEKLAKKLSEKYDYLFKKQQAIEKLEKKFDINLLESEARDEIENNEKNINKKNKIARKMEIFANNKEVQVNIAEIEKNIKQITELNELKEEVKKINDEISDIKALVATRNKDKAFVAKANAEIAQLESKRNELANKKAKITYNEATFSNDIDTQINTLKGKNDTFKSNIDTELAKQKSGVKNAIGDLNSIKPEKIKDHIKQKIDEMKQEKWDLKEKNNRLTNNLGQMAKDRPFGEVANISGSYAPFSYNPTDKEIEESDTYKNTRSGMLPASTDRKALIAWRRNYLLGNKASDGKMHPIAWLRSHFGGKRLDNKIMAEVERVARDAARRDIIAVKEQEAKDAQDATTKEQNEAAGRNAFVRSMWNKEAARAVLENKEAIATSYIAGKFIERNSAEEPEK